MKIRYRLLLLLVLFIAVATFAIDLTGSRLIGRAVSDRTLERLQTESLLLARQLETSWPEEARDADAWADLTGAALGLRVTLIDATGRVIGDSQVPLGQLSGLENHAGRPEIIEAAAHESGLSRRYSVTVGQDLEYVARRVGPALSYRGFVRLAASTDALRAISGSYRAFLTTTLWFFLCLIALVAYWTVRRFSAPIEKLSRAADQVASGQYAVAMERDSDDEIGDLVLAIERMRLALIDQIGRAESERRLLASILTGLREGILVVDQQRDLLLMNEAFRRTFNIARDVPVGTPMMQLVWDRAIVETYEEALAGKTDISRRISIPGGRAFELAVVPFVDGAGSRAGAIGLFFDVTRLESLERVRRDFVADISHELRTPLSSLKASVETLLGGALGEPVEARRFLGILMKNADRMEAILNDLTDLSLIETGSVSLSPSAVNLASAVSEAAASIAPRAAERQVTVDVRVPPGLTLRADRRRLDQILVNLLDNAVKFNRRGGSVVVSGRRDEGRVVLNVEDTGPGIPPDALERIFHRLYRVDRARSRDVPGTGLGLAIVKHLVRLHGGDIHAENREGAGTRFVVEFPFHETPGLLN